MTEGLKLGLTMSVVVMLSLEYYGLYRDSDVRLRSGLKLLLALGMILLRIFGGRDWILAGDPHDSSLFGLCSQLWPYAFIALLLHVAIRDLRNYVRLQNADAPRIPRYLNLS